MRAIASAVAAEHGLTLADLESEVRTKAIAHPRQQAMYLIRQVKAEDGRHRYSLPKIGQFFGGRDHTTVLHALRAHEKRLTDAAGAGADS